MHLDLAEGNNVKKLMKMLKIPSYRSLYESLYAAAQRCSGRKAL